MPSMKHILTVLACCVAPAHALPMTSQVSTVIPPDPHILLLLHHEWVVGLPAAIAGTTDRPELMGGPPIVALLEAAQAGDPQAMNNLGVAYTLGQVVPQNFQAAFEWFTRAESRGSLEAAHNLGLAYYLGQGVELDYARAADWFTTAADRGDASAMNHLALIFIHGLAGVQDSHRATALLQRAAALGLSVAMMNLGILYSEGRGILEDYALAYAWFTAALAHGLPRDFSESVAYRMGVLAGRMDSDTLSRARALASELAR